MKKKQKSRSKKSFKVLSPLSPRGFFALLMVVIALGVTSWIGLKEAEEALPTEIFELSEGTDLSVCAATENTQGECMYLDMGKESQQNEDPDAYCNNGTLDIRTITSPRDDDVTRDISGMHPCWGGLHGRKVCVTTTTNKKGKETTTVVKKNAKKAAAAGKCSWKSADDVLDLVQKGACYPTEKYYIIPDIESNTIFMSCIPKGQETPQGSEKCVSFSRDDSQVDGQYGVKACCPKGKVIQDGRCVKPSDPSPTPTPTPTPTPEGSPSSDCPTGESLINGQCVPESATLIEIDALGTSVEDVYPEMALYVGSEVVKTFTVTGDMTTYSYVHPSSLVENELMVKFTNDLYDPETREDRNLRVDKILVNGTAYESEDLTTYSSGSWKRSTQCEPGYKQSEWLHCNGYFQYTINPQ